MATTIQGTNGKFEVTVTGNKIEIKYIGDKTKITCKKIVMIQTVKFIIDGTVIKPPSSLKNATDWVNGKHGDDDQLTDGTVVDHSFCEKDPYYNGDDPQDIGKPGNTTTDTPSTMSDTPYLADSDLPNATSEGVLEFETCAYCVDNNTFLDCFKWTYKRKKGDAGKGTITVGNTCAGPSQSMKDAKDKFEKTHKGADGKPFCPEAKAAEDAKKKTPGGSKTITVIGGTDITLWDVLVNPGALADTSHAIDVNQASLVSTLNELDTMVQELREADEAEGRTGVSEQLADAANRARQASLGIEDGARLLRTQALGNIFVMPEEDNVPVVDDPVDVYFDYQVKITYLGAQTKSVPSIAFGSFRRTIDRSDFTAFNRAGIDYGNDDILLWAFTVRPENIRSFVNAVNANPGLSDTVTIPAEPYYSVMIVHGSGANAVCSESIVDEWSGRALITAVLESIDATNVFATELATRWSRMVTPPV